MSVEMKKEALDMEQLEIVSGGSSIDLLLLRDGPGRIPPKINHLRLGGSIANPRNMRVNRGVSFPGLREDTILLRAEIIEIEEKIPDRGESPRSTGPEPALRRRGSRGGGFVPFWLWEVRTSEMRLTSRLWTKEWRSSAAAAIIPCWT